MGEPQEDQQQSQQRNPPQLPGHIRVRSLRQLQGYIPNALPWHNISGNIAESLRYRFINITDREVDCIWVRDENNHVRYGKLRKKEYIDINTYAGHPWIFRDSEDGELFTTTPGRQEKFIPTPIPAQPEGAVGVNIRRGVLVTYPAELISLQLFSLRVISRFADITQIDHLPAPVFTRNQIRSYFRQKFDYLQEYNGPNPNQPPVVESSAVYIRNNTNNPADQARRLEYQQAVLRQRPEYRYRQNENNLPPVSSAPIPLPQRPAISAEPLPLPQRPAISSKPVALPARPAISERPVALPYVRRGSLTTTATTSADTSTELTVALSYPRVTSISVGTSSGTNGESERRNSQDGIINSRKR